MCHRVIWNRLVSISCALNNSLYATDSWKWQFQRQLLLIQLQSFHSLYLIFSVKCLGYFECTQEVNQGPWIQLTSRINSKNRRFEKEITTILVFGSMIRTVLFICILMCLYIMQAVLPNTPILSSQSYYCIQSSPPTKPCEAVACYSSMRYYEDQNCSQDVKAYYLYT